MQLSGDFRKLRYVTALLGFSMLGGCAVTDQFLIQRGDLSEVTQEVNLQREDIAQLQDLTVEYYRTLVELQGSSTRQLLIALDDYAARATCPPMPEIPVCEAPATTPAMSVSTSSESRRVNGKLVVGEVEKFLLINPGLVYNARIDSGATTSSLDARNVTRFERNGENWVRFDVPAPDNTSETLTLERRIVRNARIIQSNEEEGERRPVVELHFAIGDHQQRAEFTLSDRSHLTYPVLIGRNILRDVMLIDVGKEFATKLPTPLPRGNGDSR
ncbi:MAG: RimK/LysX family protein [Marinobacter sp.]|nr:RimK/LysX family protein [Marinobacter sp.]